MTESNVTSIDYSGKKVNYSNKSNSTNELNFDKLLIATGCANRYPPIKGLDQTKFYSLRTINDYESLNKAVR